MDYKKLMKVEEVIKQAVKRLHASDEDRDELANDILLAFASGQVKEKDQERYIKSAIKKRSINLTKRPKHRTVLLQKNSPSWVPRGVQVRDETGELIHDAVDESSEPEHGRSRIPGTLIEEAEAAESARAKQEFIRKSVRLVDLLYRISLSRDNPNVTTLLCLQRTMNALSGAKHEIDSLYFQYDNFGFRKFLISHGTRISRWLQDEIASLWSRSDSIKGLARMYRFPDFVLDAIPKLRADPIMLVLRLFYKNFKIGSGRYAARAEIREIILELKKSKAGRTDIFDSVSESTNFETLRKKIYRKASDPFYDRIAEWICEVCRPAK